MRSPLCAFFILLHCAAASATTVVVERPLMRLVSSMDTLHRLCLMEGQYDACTHFVAYRLKASCSRRGAGWAIDAQATFRPWLLLFNIRQLPHEQLHISDVRASVERYTAELEGKEFKSSADCEGVALEASSGFEQTIQRFAVESNRLRHPQVAPLR